MDIQQGKALYSRIQRLAREISAAAGSLHQQLPGTMRQAALQVYTAEPKNRFGLEFEAWWNEIHRCGTTRLSPDGTNTAIKNSILDKYLDLAMTENFLPSDSLLNKLWGSKNGTLSSIRSRTKYVGFEFRPQYGGWVVEKRPEQRPTLLKHEQPTVIVEPPAVPNLQPVLIEPDVQARRDPGAAQELDDSLVASALFDRLNRIIEQQGKIIDLMGPMFGVMKKLADAWGASA